MRTLEKLTILYIDNDVEIVERYKAFLESYCETLHVASNGEEGYTLYKVHQPDIIIMDLFVARYNDKILAKEIRKQDSKTTLIALTKYASREMLLEIIELYFSAYLIKPSNRTELLNTLLRVSKKVSNHITINLPFNSSWDNRSKTLFYQDKAIVLTKREQKLFELLVNKNGIACSDDEIFFHVWEDDSNETITNASIRTLIKNLRKKIPKGLIENQYGVGYKINL